MRVNAVWSATCGVDGDLEVTLRCKIHHSYSPLITVSCFKTLPDAHAGVRGYQHPAWVRGNSDKSTGEMCLSWSGGQKTAGAAGSQVPEAERDDLWQGEEPLSSLWEHPIMSQRSGGPWSDAQKVLHIINHSGDSSSDTCTLLQDFTWTQMWTHTLTATCFLGKISSFTGPQQRQLQTRLYVCVLHEMMLIFPRSAA